MMILQSHVSHVKFDAYQVLIFLFVVVNINFNKIHYSKIINVIENVTSI